MSSFEMKKNKEEDTIKENEIREKLKLISFQPKDDFPNTLTEDVILLNKKGEMIKKDFYFSVLDENNETIQEIPEAKANEKCECVKNKKTIFEIFRAKKKNKDKPELQFLELGICDNKETRVKCNKLFLIF